MPTHRVELLVNAELHGGFTSGTLTRSLNEPASRFDLEYSASRTDVGTGRSWPIYEGDACTLRIDDEDVITGFVDVSSVGYDPMRRTYHASGRSKVGDLIDCACMHSPRTWQRKTLADIARDAATGFACDVEVYGDSGRLFDRFKYQAGEAAIEVIRRAASLRGMHLFDSPTGNLALARVGADDSGSTLRRGQNVIKGERSGDWTQRFSEYHFCGQTHARDELTGKAGTQLRGEAVDTTVQARGRFRPFVVTKRGGGGREDLGAVAVMQRNKHAGMSETYHCTVNGWTNGNGAIWQVGELANVEDDWCGIRGRMVVSSARFTFGFDKPYQTDLELTWPEAYDEVDYPTRGRGDVWR